MSYQQTFRRLSRQLFAVLFVLIGICLLLVDFSPSQVWLPLLLVVTGIFIVSTPAEMSQQGGIIVLLFGLYLLFRAVDMITVPVLQYVFGGLFICLGVINLIRNSKGGDVPLTKTFSVKTAK